MLAEGTNVFPPDEEDVDNVFSPLREMCNDKVVSNWHFRKKKIFIGTKNIFNRMI
jgi:hypothetical protein